MIQSSDERNKPYHKLISCPWNQDGVKSDHIVEVERQSGKSNSLRLDRKSGSFISSFSFFIYKTTTIFAIILHFPARVGRFMKKTRWVRIVSLWLCLHLTFTTGNPNMFRDTWHEEIIHVICGLWIGDYKMLHRWKMTFPKLLLQHFWNFSYYCIIRRFTTENVNYKVWALPKHSSVFMSSILLLLYDIIKT